MASRKRRPRLDTAAPRAVVIAAPAVRTSPFVWLLPALVAAVLLAYYPAWHGTMLWDDDAHLTRIDLRSWSGLGRIWFELGATQQYYPIVHSAFWLQSRLWGESFLGYHLVNMALHGLSAFLLAVILRRLRVRGAVLAAVIFALHPVQVESVAWMTELKNTLSGTFYLAAALAYLRFDEQRASRHYVLALVLFALALLSKSVTATLPAALLLVLWWKRGALDWRRDVRPMVPFFLVGAAAGLMTAWVERTFIGARGADFALTPIERCLVASRALLFYAAKLIWPANLSFIYPRWTVSAAVWWQYLPPLAVVATLAALWRWRLRSRAPITAALFFAVTLAPALGFLNVYPFRYSFVADHFQYLAAIGIIAAVAAALVAAAARGSGLTAGKAEALLCVVLAVPLAALTTIQARQYVDAETLYAATLQRNPACWLCQENLGVAALSRRPPQREEAIARFREALRVNPNDPQVHNNLGTTLMEVGRLSEAVVEHQLAIRFAPGYAEAHGNLGVALQKLGRRDEAVDAYRAALEIKPGLLVAHLNLGVLLQELDRPDQAGAQLQQAEKIVQEQPSSSSPQSDLQLGNAAVQIGHFAEGIRYYQQAIRLGADSPALRAKLAVALVRAGRTEDAERELRQLIRLAPDDASAHANLAGVLLAQQQVAAAVAEYEASIRLRPDVAAVQNDLGVALAKLGRREQATGHFEQALRLQPDFPAAQANLAKALAK